MTDTATPIDPATLDRAALHARFWRSAPSQWAVAQQKLAERKAADLLSTGDLAERLGVTVTTVRAWIISGALPLPVVQVGAHRRVRRADYEAWLASAA